MTETKWPKRSARAPATNYSNRSYPSRSKRYGGVPNAIILSASIVPDGSANNTVVGTVSLVGYYIGTPVFAIVDTDSTFKINSSTGVISVNDNTDLVYATHPTITVTISVTGITPIAAAFVTPITVTEAPTNTAVPTITGSPIEGATLTLIRGTWTGNPTPVLADQWKRDTSAIGGATGLTHVVQNSDVGHTLKVTEIGTNSISAVSADSASTATVTRTTLSYTPNTSATAGSPYTGATPSPSGGTAPYNYAVAALPSWALFSTVTGLITGTPSGAESDIGIVVTAIDANGIADSSAPFAIMVSSSSGSPSLDFSDPANSQYIGTIIN